MVCFESVLVDCEANKGVKWEKEENGSLRRVTWDLTVRECDELTLIDDWNSKEKEQNLILVEAIRNGLIKINDRFGSLRLNKNLQSMKFLIWM